MNRCVFGALFVCSLVGGCSTATSASQAGKGCHADSDCKAGLSCIDLAIFDADGGCSATQRACTTPCKQEADCASLGASFGCFSGCTAGSKFCGSK